jgi:hypothetical protein
MVQILHKPSEAQSAVITWVLNKPPCLPSLDLLLRH